MLQKTTHVKIVFKVRYVKSPVYIKIRRHTSKKLNRNKVSEKIVHHINILTCNCSVTSTVLRPCEILPRDSGEETDMQRSAPVEYCNSV